MDELVKNLKRIGVLKTPEIIEAILKVDRKDFLPRGREAALRGVPDLEKLAYLDEALPIGQGQTISQPYTVAFMLELLEPKRASKIMDVGYGSGWTTALLAHIVGPPAGGGKIYAFERVKELCSFGEENLKKYPELFKRVLFFCKDASGGVSGEKFDSIIAAAEVREVPEAWREQLKIGGRLVYPKDNAVFREVKIGDNDFNVEEFPGFVFVPFIKE